MFRASLLAGLAAAFFQIHADEWPKFEPYDLPADKNCRTRRLTDPSTEVKVNGKRLAGDGLIEDSRTALEYCKTFQRKVKKKCEEELDYLIEQIDLKIESVDGKVEIVTGLSPEGINNVADLLGAQDQKCAEEFKDASPFCFEIGAKVIATFNEYRQKLMDGNYCAGPIERAAKAYDSLIAAVGAKDDTELVYQSARLRVYGLVYTLERLKAREPKPGAEK